MPHFDANDDPIQAPGADQGDSPEPPEIQPVIRRARRVARRRRLACRRAPATGALPAMGAGRRQDPRCERRIDRRPLTIVPPSRQRRRLWTLWHGRPPGPAS
jgi:hypothetical protein